MVFETTEVKNVFKFHSTRVRTLELPRKIFFRKQTICPFYDIDLGCICQFCKIHPVICVDILKIWAIFPDLTRSSKLQVVRILQWQSAHYIPLSTVIVLTWTPGHVLVIQLIYIILCLSWALREEISSSIKLTTRFWKTRVYHWIHVNSLLIDGDSDGGQARARTFNP